MNAEETINALLTKWASAPSGINAESREALCASVVGAIAVDGAITKMASNGSLTADEAEFLRGLHAESVGVEIDAFTKSAGVPEFLGNALMAPAHHPKLTGALIGAGLGAGLGAWKDDDDRLRGAALYAIPGAAIGAIGGALGEEAIGRWANRQPHSLTEQAEGLVPDALALARLRTQGAVDRTHRAQVSGDRINAVGAFDQFDKTLATRHVARLREEAALAGDWSKAIGTMRDRRADAERMHDAMLDAAGHHAAFAQDPQHKVLFEDIHNYLTKHAPKLIEHMTVNPGKVHKEMLLLEPDVQPYMTRVLTKARELFSQGASP